MWDMAAEEDVEALLAAGDLEGAATTAIRTFGPRILGYLRAVLRDEGDASEAFAGFAEDLWRGLPRFRRECAFRSWAYKIAWNAALHVRDDAFRRRGRRLETGEASRLAEEIRRSSIARVEHEHSALDRLRDALTPEERTLLVLRVDQQLPWDEIAEIVTGEGEVVTAATLRKRFERLKDRLAALARAEGLVE
jgi:RNA polymerase sigma-70 factor (ECF subfamily)